MNPEEEEVIHRSVVLRAHRENRKDVAPVVFTILRRSSVLLPTPLPLSLFCDENVVELQDTITEFQQVTQFFAAMPITNVHEFCRIGWFVAAKSFPNSLRL